jgi:hypothetical protein
VSPFLRNYALQRTARNSAKSSKPAFFNIDREIRLTKDRDAVFRREIEAAVEKLGDMTVFEKYRGKEGRRSIAEEGKEKRKRGGRVGSVDVRREVEGRGKGIADIPLSTRTYYECSTIEKSTPMHQDPRYTFPLPRSHHRNLSLAQTRTMELDQVLSRCMGLESACTATNRAAVKATQVALQSTRDRFERVTEMVESLQMQDMSLSFNANLQRIRAEKGINRRLLESAGKVRKSYLDSSEFASKYKQKEIWRVPTLALARHTDRLINSLPSSLSP